MRLAAAGSGLALAASLMAGPVLADSRVQDRASGLFESTEADLEARLDDIAARTGVDVYVVLDQDLAGMTAEEAAKALPLWSRPGRKLVLYLAMADRQVRIEADPELGVRHADETWARLIEARMLTDLRAARQAAAIRSGLDAIEDQLTQGRAVAVAPPVRTMDALRDMVFILLAGLIAGLSFNRMRKERVWRARW